MDLSQTLPGDKDNGEENNQTLGNRKCTMCDYQTSSFSGLQQHLISHARKHLIKCALCGNHYKDYVKMVKHMEFKHPHCRIYKCIFCSKKFVDEKDLTEHIQTHPDRKYFQCPNPACPEQFTKLIEMYEHMKGDHDLYKDESFDNPQIVIEIDTDNEYDDLCKTDGLRSTLEEVNKFNCITCDMKLNTEDEYRQHLIAHEIVQKKQKKATKEKPGYQCQICSMFFVSKVRLNNHLKLHQHCFKCMFCDKLLNSMKKIETHVSSSHQRKLAKLGPNVLPYIEVKYDDLVIAGNNEQFNMINKTKAIVPDKKAKKNNMQQSQSIPTQSTIAMPSCIVNDYKNILHNDSKVQSLENAPHEHHLSHSDLAVTEDKLMLANAKETIEVDLTKVKIEPDITAGSQLMVKEQKTEQSQGARNGSKRKGSPTKYIKRNSAWNDKSEFETGESEIKAEVQEQDNEYFKAGIVSSLNKRARIDLLFEEAGKMRVDNFNKYGPERQYDDMANCGEEHTQYINEIAGTVKQFICPVEGCGKPFLKEKNREKHILINHSGMKPEYFCKACDKYFLRKKEYLIHRRIHEDKKMVECPYCNKMYSGGTNLKAHILTHTGKRPFECKICKRCFTQNSSLRRHLVTHTGIKQFECKFCGKPFARYDDLKTHTRIHTGEKPYVCEVCGRAFTQNGPLIKHREIHEKEGRMSPEKSKLIRRTLPRYPFEKRMDGDNQTDIADSGFLTKVASDSSLYQIRK
ncbi:ZN566-like protein [Mya arenaria]|uniref:ZN566-like protein n=1 Tax=Mya arenaria TaxID=6604 RepID=A0ABY7G989_MYAAR|nr:ZN566-like protein [Mya arenaria]